MLPPKKHKSAIRQFNTALPGFRHPAERDMAQPVSTLAPLSGAHCLDPVELCFRHLSAAHLRIKLRWASFAFLLMAASSEAPLERRMVPPEGFEPPTTGPKPVVISISPQGRGDSNTSTKKLLRRQPYQPKTFLTSLARSSNISCGLQDKIHDCPRKKDQDDTDERS